MKRFLIVAALVALSATDAEACLAGRRSSRQVSRTRTVEKVAAPAVIAVPPPVVKVEVVQPKPVVQAAPVIQSAATVERNRSRSTVRSVVGIPLTAMSKLRSVVPCPNCR